MTDPETQFQNRNEQLRHTIDVLAQNDYDEHGQKAELAREHGLAPHRIDYVVDRWEHLVEWRRNANADPLDPDAVKAAYDDDTLAAMATLAGDGAGDVNIPIEVSLDEAFRMMKLLPGDLGLTVFRQVLEASASIPPEVIRGVNEEG